MTAKLISLDNQGNGYCVVYKDDGSSFGQELHNSPVTDMPSLLKHISSLVFPIAERPIKVDAPVAQEIISKYGEVVILEKVGALEVKG
mgnify:CR=1 FL=1